ncbi:hypothetical protein D6D13_10219 [Aureobasidium pullulans]|uniref:Uncharacterized protein n=1 Tax=Aureobasidium pullulans TaxID=5580 RepID=A0A4S9BYZ0_AURPU|nr:hypothetical protein D6D13_10219 [Aureobasidium pullulans]
MKFPPQCRLCAKYICSLVLSAHIPDRLLSPFLAPAFDSSVPLLSTAPTSRFYPFKLFRLIATSQAGLVAAFLAKNHRNILHYGVHHFPRTSALSQGLLQAIQETWTDLSRLGPPLSSDATWENSHTFEVFLVFHRISSGSTYTTCNLVSNAIHHCLRSTRHVALEGLVKSIFSNLVYMANQCVTPIATFDDKIAAQNCLRIRLAYQGNLDLQSYLRQWK